VTIHIQAYQRRGIKTNELVDSYTFCCWDSLSKWLNGYGLNKCPKCKEEEKND